MAESRESLFDSMQDVTGGVNSGYSPDIIMPNQLAWGTNLSLRGGKAHNRPTFVERATLASGKLQGASYFSANGGVLMCSIDGQIYQTNIINNNFSSQFLIPPDKRNSRYIDTVNFCEASGYMLINDGQSKAFIYDGSSLSRANDNQIPICTQCVYGNGRLWCLFKNQVFAGDIYQGGITHLSFTEITYLSGGGAFLLPENGTAMVFNPRIDNTTATGDLLCFTEHTTTAIQATIFDRSLWQTTQGMQKMLFPAIGCSGNNSIAAVNQDIYFQSTDGIRSLRNTFTTLQTPGNTPISKEVTRVIAYDTRQFLKYKSGIYFDNRFLLASNPRIVEHISDIDQMIGFNHPCQKIISLDFDAMSSLGQVSPMIFEGEWTGLNVVKFVKGFFGGVERLFAFCSDLDGTNKIYEILREDEGTFDVINSVRQRIPSSIETRRFEFQAPFTMKQIWSAQIWFHSIIGNVDYQAYYKPDYWPCWIPWANGTLCAQFEQCAAPSNCGNLPNFQPGYRPKLILPQPPFPSENNYLDSDTSIATSFQFRLDFTGNCGVDQILIVADPVSQTNRGEADLLNYGGGGTGSQNA